LDALAVGQRVVLHAEDADDVIADLEVRMLRRGHLAERAGAHHFANADWRHVRLAFVHPAAHRGIERDVQIPHDELTVVRLRHGRLRVIEVLALHHPHRTLRELELTVHHGHRCSPYALSAASVASAYACGCSRSGKCPHAGQCLMCACGSNSSSDSARVSLWLRSESPQNSVVGCFTPASSPCVARPRPWTTSARQKHAPCVSARSASARNSLFCCLSFIAMPYHACANLRFASFIVI